jgi:hypothetical protein
MKRNRGKLAGISPCIEFSKLRRQTSWEHLNAKKEFPLDTNTNYLEDWYPQRVYPSFTKENVMYSKKTYLCKKKTGKQCSRGNIIGGIRYPDGMPFQWEKPRIIPSTRYPCKKII